MADTKSEQFGYDFFYYLLSQQTHLDQLSSGYYVTMDIMTISGPVVLDIRDKSNKDDPYVISVDTENKSWTYGTGTSVFYMNKLDSTVNGDGDRYYYVQILDVLGQAETDQPTYIYISTSNPDTLYINTHTSLDNIDDDENAPNNMFQIQGINIYNILDTASIEPYITQLLYTTSAITKNGGMSGLDYTKCCCGVNAGCDNPCYNYCGVIGYFVENNMPSTACDEYFGTICASQSASSSSSSSSSSPSGASGEDMDVLCGCYSDTTDPIYDVYNSLGYDIPSSCFNPNCRDSSVSYFPSTLRNINCPNICAGIVNQKVGKYGVLENSNMKVDVTCGSSGDIDLVENFQIKPNSVKLSNKSSNTSIKNSNAWIWLVVILGTLAIIGIIFLILILKKKYN